MSEQNFRETAEKYRSEMMKIYGNRSAPMEAPQAEAAPEEPAFDDTENINENIPEEPERLNEPEENPYLEEDNIEERFPPPEIPVFMQTDGQTRTHPEPVISFNNGQTENISKIRETQWPDYSMKDPPDYSDIPREPEFITNPAYTKWGFLKINVRTGSSGIPVPNAAVTLTRKYNGKEELLVLTTTDINGETEIFRLPAPPTGIGNSPEDYEHYSMYFAEVYAKGYYREVSQEIPIFENITSIQTFNLIPEPYSFDSGGNYIAYSNTEPDY